MLTLKSLFFKKLYEQEILRIVDSTEDKYVSLDKSILEPTITLRWLVYNRSFVIKNIISYLKNREYKPPIAIEKSVYAKDKFRKMYFFDWHIRVLHGVLARLLTRELNKILPKEVTSYRKGVGFLSTILEAANYIKAYNSSCDKSDIESYITRKDVKSYGDSINLDILYKVIKENLNLDNDLYRLVKNLLSFKYISEDDGKTYTKKIGLPTGSPLNTVFTNLYLLELDRDFSHKGIFYRRYVDDIIVISDDILTTNDTLERYRKKYALVFNQKKDGLLNLKNTSFKEFAPEMLKYLGLMIDYRGEIYLSIEKDKKIKDELLSTMRLAYLSSRKDIKDKEILIKIMINSLKILVYKTDLYSYINGFIGILSKQYLKSLDLWLAKNLLKLVYNVPLDRVFKRFSYRKLRELGLFSFQHLKVLREYNKRGIEEYFKIEFD